MHNKYNALESSSNHLPPLHPSPWKTCLPWNRSLVPKRSGTAVLESLFLFRWKFSPFFPHFVLGAWEVVLNFLLFYSYNVSLFSIKLSLSLFVSIYLSMYLSSTYLSLSLSLSLSIYLSSIYTHILILSLGLEN